MNDFDCSIEKICIDSVETNKNMYVPWYLMASYAYYVEDDPIISDRTFDLMGKRMLEMWDDIEHIHKECISIEDLKGGTFLGEYPSRIESAVKEVRKI